MPKKKTYTTKEEPTKVNEPIVAYEKKRILVFKSFEEQEEYELKQMAALNSIEILQQLRKFINTAYAMSGYNPNNLPKKHVIKIIQK